MTELIRHTQPTLDNILSIQLSKQCKILFAKGQRWAILGLPLKIGIPKYMKGKKCAKLDWWATLIVFLKYMKDLS